MPKAAPWLFSIASMKSILFWTSLNFKIARIITKDGLAPSGRKHSCLGSLKHKLTKKRILCKCWKKIGLSPRNNLWYVFKRSQKASARWPAEGAISIDCRELCRSWWRVARNGCFDVLWRGIAVADSTHCADLHFACHWAVRAARPRWEFISKWTVYTSDSGRCGRREDAIFSSLPERPKPQAAGALLGVPCPFGKSSRSPLSPCQCGRMLGIAAGSANCGGLCRISELW